MSGEDPERLIATGRYALEAGLELWFSPMTYDMEPEAFTDYMAGCAAAADPLRDWGEVVAVLGCEMSLFCAGFVPGNGLTGRMATMADPATWTNPETVEQMTAGFTRAQEAQRSITTSARKAFGGRLTYAAGMWEQVDWELFDIVSVDGYRDAANAADYREQIRRYHDLGRPLAITEFGCCTYDGAADRGGSGWRIVARDGDRAVLDRPYERDEGEQVRYFRELMALFDEESVDSAFWFTFAGFALPRRPDTPERDLDVASYGAVAVSDAPAGSPWEPKQVFDAIATDFEGRRSAVEAVSASR